jgi:hypothetical protein
MGLCVDSSAAVKWTGSFGLSDALVLAGTFATSNGEVRIAMISLAHRAWSSPNTPGAAYQTTNRAIQQALWAFMFRLPCTNPALSWL